MASSWNVHKSNIAIVFRKEQNREHTMDKMQNGECVLVCMCVCMYVHMDMDMLMESTRMYVYMCVRERKRGIRGDI